jgi:hypothetical protein
MNLKNLVFRIQYKGFISMVKYKKLMWGQIRVINIDGASDLSLKKIHLNKLTIKWYRNVLSLLIVVKSQQKFELNLFFNSYFFLMQANHVRLINNELFSVYFKHFNLFFLLFNYSLIWHFLKNCFCCLIHKPQIILIIHNANGIKNWKNLKSLY